MAITWVPVGAKGVDFSYTKPPPARLVELGYEFIVGYFSTPPSNPKKNLTNPHDYLDAGLNVVYVFEKSATRATEGGHAGYVDAMSFVAFLDSIGCPHAVAPQMMADDTGTTVANKAAKLDYMAAAASVMANRGMYAGSKLGAYCQWGLGWLPNAWSWSEGVNTPTALSRADARQEAINIGYHVVQSTGFYIDGLYPVDPNEVVRAFPAWSNESDPNPLPQGVIRMDVVTNASDWDSGPAGTVKFALQYAGQALYHLTPVEWAAGGSQPGVPMSNEDLEALAAIPAGTAIDYAAVAAKVAPLLPPPTAGTIDNTARQGVASVQNELHDLKGVLRGV